MNIRLFTLRNIIAVFVIILSANVYGQFPNEKDSLFKWGKEDLEKIKSFEAQLKQAEALTTEGKSLENEARELKKQDPSEENSKLQKKIKKLQDDGADKHIAASAIYSEVYLGLANIYKVYSRKYVSGFKEDKKKLAQGKEWEDQAEENLKKSKNIRKETDSYTNKRSKAFRMQDADNLEKDAAINHLNAMRFYLSYPNSYPFDNNTGTTTTAVVTNTPIVNTNSEPVINNTPVSNNTVNYIEPVNANNQAVTNPVVTNARSEQKLLFSRLVDSLGIVNSYREMFQQYLFETYGTRKSGYQPGPSGYVTAFPDEVSNGWKNFQRDADNYYDSINHLLQNELTLAQQPVQNVSASTNQPEVFFSVQIAASRIELRNNDIADIYKGDKEVIKARENDWYKYAVGKFASYNEANAYCPSVGIQGAFVVAFVNGQKVPVADARKLLNGQNVSFAPSSPSIKINELNTQTVPSGLKDKVIYRIVVASGSTQLSGTDVAKLYKGNKKVWLLREAKTYTYFIEADGGYSQSAQERFKTGIKNAYILPLCNNQKLKITDVIKSN